MAEAAVAIGLVASIATLIDFSERIVSRVKDYNGRSTEVPKTFRSLTDRLPLLNQTLKSIQVRAKGVQIASDVANELDVLLNGVLQDVKLVEHYLQRILPGSNTSRLGRVLVGLKSVAKDDKVSKAVAKIHHAIDVLVLHQTTNTMEASDRILHELKKLSVQDISSQKSTSDMAEQLVFGLCLANAPLIEPDAFIGRRAELQQLHEWLLRSQNPSIQRVVSIAGLGGLGKTQLSLTYARNYGHEYTSVFWLNAKSETTLRQSMSTLTSVIFSDNTFAATTADDEIAKVKMLREWLSKPGNDQWLIIFDNYDDPALPNLRSPTGYDIRQYFPMRTQGSILITTRSPKLAFSKTLKLQKLPDIRTSVAILSQRSGRDMKIDSDCDRLALRLDGLPLALAVAGTYLAQISASCGEYLDLYETAWHDLHDAEELMDYEDRNLSSTWSISLQQIRRQDTDAADLLHFFAYLNNDDIWYELIKSDVHHGPSWMHRVTSSKMHFDRAMSKLGDYSLVEARGESYRLHPCLHDWISERPNTPLDPDLFLTVLECLQQNVRRNPTVIDPNLGIVSRAESVHYWSMSRRLSKHIERLHHKKFAPLWDALVSNTIIYHASHLFGDLYRHISELENAENMYARALKGKEIALGPNHISTLLTVDRFGILYCIQGKLAMAEQYHRRALTGLENALGRDHTSTIAVMHHLGADYFQQNRLEEAEQLLIQVLAARTALVGPTQPALLGTMIDLGAVYSGQGKLAESEEMVLRALTTYEEIVGLDHVITLTPMNNLGVLYIRQNKIAEAVDIFYRTLARMEKLLGPEHLSTLNTMGFLGTAYMRQGRIEEAMQLFQRAVAGRRKVLGPHNPATKIALNNLERLQNYYSAESDEGIRSSADSLEKISSENSNPDGLPS